MKIFLVFAFAAVSISALAQTVPPAPGTYPFQNPKLPTAARVADLLSRMTLAEKIDQLHNTTPAIERLGIPAFDWWNEALHGVARSGIATVFPQAIGMASTWDETLMGEIATTISTEARAKNTQALKEGNHSIYYGLTFWSPNINIFRDPRWGRGQETYGEDPYLTGRMGVEFVKGMQGDDAKYLKTVATPKHFAVHSGPEATRHSADVEVSPHDLEDTYLPAFRAAVVDGHAQSVMCAYNAVDGKPACASELLLKDHLRDAWGFTGYVTSDCGAVGDFYTPRGHHYSADAAHAAVAGLTAGDDSSCGGEYPAGLKKAFEEGIATMPLVDTALTRLMTARFRLGLFDPPAMVKYAQIPFSVVDSAAHRELALKVARESMVLLKNANHALPLAASAKSILVVGPNAESLTAIEGNYNGTPKDPSLPLAAIRAGFPGAKVRYAQGSAYAPGLVVTIPSTVFHQAGGAPGLKAEYFNQASFDGAPALTRVDPAINFDWRARSPAEGIGAEAFAVRWSGTITVPAPADIPINMALTECHPCRDVESFAIFLDGKEVGRMASDSPGYGQRSGHASVVHIGDTQSHAIRVEYSHRGSRFGAGIVMNWVPDADTLRQEAVTAAAQADVVVAVMGLSSDLEGEESTIQLDGFSRGDRTKITLPQVQENLLEGLVATGKPLVLVLENGSAVATPEMTEKAAAILEAWYPGEAGGEAIADTLAGRNNPGGRLPVTFYRSEAQLPAFEDYNMANRTYRYFGGDPLYRFGYGLSYSSFSYRNVKLSTSSLPAGSPLEVEADVTNTSKLAGDEVAELYLIPPTSTTNPRLTLQGFERVTLKPGETRHLRFHLVPRQLSMVDADGNRAMVPGNYRISVAGAEPASLDEGVALTITANPKAPPIPR